MTARARAADFDGIVAGVPTATPRERVDYRLRTLCNRVRMREGLEDFETPEVFYYRNRSSAGIAHHDRYAIGIHETLLEENLADMIYETVAHELAHLVRGVQFKRRMISSREFRQAHGDGWQNIMRAWFDVQPSRTHNYDMTNVAVRRQRLWRYECECREHRLTTVRHNKLRRGTSRYRCKDCKSDLTFNGEST